jgi:hypothetical protein
MKANEEVEGAAAITEAEVIQAISGNEVFSSMIEDVLGAKATADDVAKADQS